MYTDPNEYVDNEEDMDILEYHYKTLHWKPIDKDVYSFPPPTDINVNMMPFVVEKDFPTIPDYCRGYLPLISACCDNVSPKYDFQGGRKKKGARLIYYLTIHECFVPAGTTQRRPGLHTDAHANADWGAECTKGDGYWHCWGAGEDCDPHLPRRGGIFLASNVPNSTAVWNCGILRPGLLGDCEELRDRLSKYGPIMLEANRLYWITDRTPHEALPLEEGVYRQFFRLVTDKVDVWYEQHSTPNPIGIVPPPECRIITENKFGVLLK